MSESPDEFKYRLQQEGRRYLALSPINQPQIHVRFPGRFQDREIIWDAHLQTLRYIHEQLTSNEKLTAANRQFIEIGDARDHLVPITVALNVPQFDEPAILKTIIMIHNYKRLRLGRHEFGEPVNFF